MILNYFSAATPTTTTTTTPTTTTSTTSTTSTETPLKPVVIDEDGQNVAEKSNIEKSGKTLVKEVTKAPLLE